MLSGALALTSDDLPPAVVRVAHPGLMLVGVALSIVLSRWYPRWLVSRRILGVRRRYGGTWTAPGAQEATAGRSVSERGPVAPNVPGQDVVIVGSGIGGLACAALLAKRGLRVLLLEQHAVVGGFCHSFVRNRRRFRFDAAVHDISGLGERGPVRHLLRALEIEEGIEFLRMDHEYVVAGLRVRVPRGAAAFEAELRARFPREAAGISAFFTEIEAIYRDVYRDVERTGGVPKPPDDVEGLLRYPADHPDHARGSIGRTAICSMRISGTKPSSAFSASSPAISAGRPRTFRHRSWRSSSVATTWMAATTLEAARRSSRTRWRG